MPNSAYGGVFRSVFFFARRFRFRLLAFQLMAVEIEWQKMANCIIRNPYFEIIIFSISPHL